MSYLLQGSTSERHMFRYRRAIISVSFTILIASSTLVKAAETIAYTYDALGRIVTVASSGTVNNGIQTTYTHDKADNRQRVVVTGASH